MGRGQHRGVERPVEGKLDGRLRTVEVRPGEPGSPLVGSDHGGRSLEGADEIEEGPPRCRRSRSSGAAGEPDDRRTRIRPGAAEAHEGELDLAGPGFMVLGLMSFSFQRRDRPRRLRRSPRRACRRPPVLGSRDGGVHPHLETQGAHETPVRAVETDGVAEEQPQASPEPIPAHRSSLRIRPAPLASRRS